MCAHADSDTYSNSYTYSDADGYTYIHTKAYAYTEGCPNAETASDAGAPPVGPRAVAVTLPAVILRGKSVTPISQCDE